MKGIPLYEEINQLHEMTGSAIRSPHPLFHCFEMDQTNDLQTNQVGPHRASFYTLAISFGTEALAYTLGKHHYDPAQNFILCVSPGQIVEWKKGGAWRGYCIFFKPEFLQISEQLNLVVQFPFFSLLEEQLLSLDEGSFRDFKEILEQILKEQKLEKKYQWEVIKSLFQSLLWKVRRQHEAHLPTPPAHPRHLRLAAEFQLLLQAHFLTETTVEAYAKLLHLSANHLSQSIKLATGQTAKSLINQRRLEEAKYLLAYTPASISEIAFHLSFRESTHFSKFFKKGLGYSPQDYRQKQFDS
ncbi:MAG: helix-turn-helix transcriptional regulator [Bacteroidota bacterium]